MNIKVNQFNLAGKILFILGLIMILLNVFGLEIPLNDSLLFGSLMVIVGLYLIVVPK